MLINVDQIDGNVGHPTAWQHEPGADDPQCIHNCQIFFTLYADTTCKGYGMLWYANSMV